MKTWDKEKGVIDFENLEPRVLPLGFSIEDVTNTAEDYDEIMDFFNINYNCSSSGFSMEYSHKHFLWYFGSSVYDFIKLKFENKIIGCVSGKLDYTNIKNNVKKVYIINHLCISKESRNLGIINFLIAEIGRLALIKGITIGLYITKHKHKKPLCKVKSYSLYKNPEILEQQGYIKIPDIKFLRSYYLSRYKLNPSRSSLFKIEKNKKVDGFITLQLNIRYSSLGISQHFNAFNCEMFNDPEIVTTFTFSVGKVCVGFVSYYHLNIINRNTKKNIKQVYILYYWWDDRYISERELFSNTITFLDVDLITTYDIDIMKDINLRKELKINNKHEEYYYYIYNSCEKLNGTSKRDIGLFLS